MSRRFDLTLIDGLTSVGGKGTVGPADIQQCTELAIYVSFDDTSAAGVVLIETAPSINYAGTWAVLATVTWAAAGKTHYVALTGIYRAIRARISSAVTSGTVTAVMSGNS